MIDRSALIEIGKIVKTHGTGGEVVASLTVGDVDFDASEYLVCDVDGIFVPFFLESYRYRGNNSAILKFSDVDDMPDTAVLLGRNLYFPREKCAGATAHPSISDTLCGYHIIISGGRIGEITAIGGTPDNPLFAVSGEAKEYLIPATDDFVVSIDDDARTIEMELPEGLLEL